MQAARDGLGHRADCLAPHHGGKLHAMTLAPHFAPLSIPLSERLHEALAHATSAARLPVDARLVQRAREALCGPPGADGLPDLSFLSRRQQVSVLAVAYAAAFAARASS